ncbi:hypothetical protein LSTR_LSTR004144 [Laodelphax striatellus]|uniref:DAZ-associated protein 2 n=1 Tax=Laodelphax striatellus TaxID=195883 RepID=A0A482X9D5_LAOST|nr:hypothetical protein LSTR_LSTR004144 [Laodelphax striatellus]
MSEKKAYPGAPQAPPTGFVPTPPHPVAAAAAAAYAVPTAAPYGVFPAQAQLYAAAQAAPPPTYDQALTPAAIVGQQFQSVHNLYNTGQRKSVADERSYLSSQYYNSAMYQPGAAAAAAAAASMYAAQGYPGYLGYPAAGYSTMQAAYYPTLATYSYPHHQLRPTIMVPNAFEAGARFDGIAQPVLPPAPPGVPPSPAQLAAMAGHNVALTQKKGSFLTGSGDGGYTFW